MLIGVHTFKVRVVYLRSGLVSVQVFKVKVDQRSCFEGKGCLVMRSSRSGLLRGQVLNAGVDKKSCFQGQG